MKPMSSREGNLSRRRFLKLTVSGAVVVVVVAGVGAYFALQPQPPPAVPVTTPIPLAPVSPATTPTPMAPPKPSPTPTLVDKANEEGAVMLYSVLDEFVIKVTLDGFMKKYPKIKAEFYRASGTLPIQRVLTEYRAGKHTMDTFVGSPTYIYPALEEDLVAQYDSPEAKVYPAELKDQRGLWTAVQYSPQAIAYNTERVKGTDIPQSYWDVLKPRFKDQVGLYDPTGGPHSLVISKRKIIGPDRWMEWLNGLKAQNPKSIRGSPQLIALLRQGEIHIGFWAYTGTVVEQIQQGAPIDYVRKPNTLLSPPTLGWIYKYAPHPNAARLLYDYMISEEGQTLVNNMGVYVVARPGIPPKMGLGIGTGEPVRPEYVASVWPYIQKDLDEAAAEWKRVFPI